MRPLLRQGVDLVTKALGTERLCDEQFSAPYIATFYLGPEFDARPDLMKNWLEEDLQPSLYMFIREGMQISNNVFQVFEGRACMRITAHVFNTLQDYEKLANALLKMREEIKMMSVEEV